MTTVDRVDAVLAARRRGDTVSTSRYVELIHATYPEALAVVRDVVSDHEALHDLPIERCTYPTCRSAAAYLTAVSAALPEEE